MADTTDASRAPTARQMRILALVVREHVRSARPVSSGRLVRCYNLGVSAATVRSDMARLELLGLLTHPHTSAGRTPTMAGYRYFVEHLMRHARLAEAERQSIRAGFVAAGGNPERWMQLSATAVAQTSGAAGLVAAPRNKPSALRHLKMVDLGGDQVLLVAVLANGDVQQARWSPTSKVDQPSLDRISQRLMEAVCGSEPTSCTVPSDGSKLERECAQAVLELLRRASRPRSLRLYHAGLTQVLLEPEFAGGRHLRSVVSMLEHGDGLEPVLEILPGSGVTVIIGGEPPLENVPHVTLVLSRFGQRTSQDGVLGVVGPTRMPYERAVPTVEFVAELMTQLLAGESVLAD